MRRFRYEAPTEFDGYKCVGYETITLTEQEIIDQYYETWKNALKLRNDVDRISLENKKLFLEDWCIMHYAWEVKEDDI